jgi:polysaccharide deacetylase family protein (PEP-CTERM system associated)
MARMTTERVTYPGAALSIDVEDWFHTDNLRDVITRQAWENCELRVERNTMRMLEILQASNTRATFFVLGWVAEKCPHLVRAIAAAGHEIASHGYGHEHVYSLQPREFRADVVRSKQCLEDLTGKAVRGYRAPSFSITDWAIPILQDVGFDYDSSAVQTIAHDRYGRLSGMHAGRPIVSLGDGFYEVCVSCIRLGERGIPWGGGGLFPAHSLPVVASRRTHDPALWKPLRLLYPSVGDRSRTAARGRDKGKQFIPPTRQPASVRGTLRCACRRFRVDAGLRSHG